MDGIINIYKERGFTSHDVVAKLRGILRTKKIGHTGTLDPDASGVLPVCVGRATKLCDMFAEHDKVYECTIRLGTATDTEDIGGTVIASADISEITEERFLAALRSFSGTYMQIPPMYSAIKVNGRKLYELAREGKVIERAPRRVEIYSVEMLPGSVFSLPDISFRVHCSKGTYVRSLCRDIGERLGSCACMKTLVRTRTGQFRLEDALTLEQVAEAVRTADGLGAHLLSFEQIFASYPAARIRPDKERLLLNGNPLGPDDLEELGAAPFNGTGEICVYDLHGRLIGLYAARAGKERLYPEKMFL